MDFCYQPSGGPIKKVQNAQLRGDRDEILSKSISSTSHDSNNKSTVQSAHEVVSWHGVRVLINSVTVSPDPLVQIKHLHIRTFTLPFPEKIAKLLVHISAIRHMGLRRQMDYY